MGKYVTDADKELEVKMLRFVMARFEPFKGYKFVHNSDTAVMDFEGFKDGKSMTVEVKVRDIASDQYRDYFISEDKYKAVCNDWKRSHWIIYGFTTDRVVRVYDLAHSPLTPRQLSFKHKRANKQMESQVYCVEADSHIAEWQV